MKTYLLVITALVGSYEKQILSEIIKLGYQVGPIQFEVGPKVRVRNVIILRITSGGEEKLSDIEHKIYSALCRAGMYIHSALLIEEHHGVSSEFAFHTSNVNLEELADQADEVLNKVNSIIKKPPTV